MAIGHKILKVLLMTNIYTMNQRNFKSISPSAKSILLLKGYTNIPFARRTAELLSEPDEFNPDFSIRDMTFWARILHFENRYLSIDKLFEDLPVKNILELSSGYSFRSLAAICKDDVHYIDTDLQDVISLKKEFIEALTAEENKTSGKLELEPLNCLDEEQFQEIAGHFTDGQIVIVNEGLLMYLNDGEKEKLCRIIHKILEQRGGYWINADIYLKNKQEKLDLKIDSKTKEFFLQHKIEENKFNSFKDAELFFKKMGFVIDKEAVVDRSELSSMKYFLKSVSFKQLLKVSLAGKIQKTWRLRIDQ